MTDGSDQAVDLVLSMDVPKEVLTKRITGRRICKGCGEIYNVYYKAPANEGVCDICGQELSQRKDDNEDSIKVRLDEYAANTEPVIGYYDDKDMVAHINADQSMEDIWSFIQKTIDEK